MKRHATTIVLILLAIGLSVWLFVDRDAVTQGEKMRRENSVFPAWRREELSRVEIRHEGETVVLERDAKKDAPWRMTSPRADKCDQAAIERLLTTFEFAVVARKASEGGALGLDPPRASGSVTMGGVKLTFALGGTSPRPEGSSYFRVDKDAPIVVSKELTQALLQPSDTYRDRTVVPYLSIDLARFEVKREGGGFSLERASERTFRISELGVLAANPALDKVWNALAEMRAESFPKDGDVASPEITLRMTPKDASKPPAELVIGGACPGHPDDVIVLRRAPDKVAACAPRSALEALRAQPSALVDRRPIPLRADEIEELRLEWIEADAGAGAPKAIDIARKGTTWHEREPLDHDLGPDENDAASVLVQRIAETSAITVTKGNNEPFPAIARAKAHFGDEEHVVEIGPLVSDARVVLRRVSDGARLEVTFGSSRRFVPRSSALRSRRLVPTDRRVKRVLLRCGVPQELVDKGEGLRLVDPPGYETDSEITALVDALTRGKIEAWISDTIDPGFGLGEDACHIVLGFDDDKGSMTIRFGTEGETGVFGTIEGSDTSVFVAPRSTGQLARAIYVSRASMRLPAAQIDKLKVTIGGKPAAHVDPSAFATFYADRVTRLGKGAGTSDVGKVEVTIDATSLDAGPARHVVCGPLTPSGQRPCAMDGLSVTYLVPQGRIARLLGELPDAGDAEVAPDGGPR